MEKSKKCFLHDASNTDESTIEITATNLWNSMLLLMSSDKILITKEDVFVIGKYAPLYISAYHLVELMLGVTWS